MDDHNLGERRQDRKMVKFSILVPDATLNYVKNPALRYDATGWNAQGSTITRSLEQARFGIASLKVITNASANREGCFYRVNSLTNISEPITVSCYVRGAGKVRLRVIANPTGTERVSEGVFLRSDRWTRLSVTGRSIGSNDVRLYVETDEGSAKARTFYVDGAQMERKAYPTTYCDGDQEKCRWNGTYHGSTSQRNAYTRAGGRWIQLAGEEREAEDLYMTAVGGLGVAPIQNNVQSFALEPGGYMQNVKINSRVITLAFFSKHYDQNSRNQTVTLSALHQLRQFLIDVVKPDKTAGNEEIWFEYQDGDKPLYFKARYDGGLEGEWDVRNQWINSFPLRLLCTSPMIYEDSQDAASLDFQDMSGAVGLNIVQEVMGRIDGRWSGMNGGMNNDVDKLALGPDGKIYAIGRFTFINGPSYITPAGGIAYWDGEAWTSAATNISLGGRLYSIAVAPNGYVYVCGDFTSIGGVAANNIAYWNGSAWNAMGTGLNSFGRVVRVAPNGDVYAGGEFTTAGGIACTYIARWDGFQWRRVGQFGGMNQFVLAIAISIDGSVIYIGGAFTDQNGFAANAMLRVASYNTTTGLFSAMGSGVNNKVYALCLTPSNILYAGGIFTASGSGTINRIGYWNGSSWIAMGTGVNSDVNDIQAFSDSSILIVGLFTTAGGKFANGAVLWNGSTFFNLDMRIELTSSPTSLVNGALIDRSTDDIYMGGDILRIISSGQTILDYPGASETRPILYIKGPCNVYWIENQTTGKRMNLDLTVQNTEEVFIDPARGLFYSFGRGNLLYTLLPGSDFRNFTLVPGENKLAIFGTNDVGAIMQIYYAPVHWSVDETQNEESL